MDLGISLRDGGRNGRGMPFAALGLSPALVRAAAASRFLTPTPVQEVVIPAVLRGRDVWGQARTGTGKTAAFVLPLLQDFEENRLRRDRPRAMALVVTPTRELATQVAEVFWRIGRSLVVGPKVVTAAGGGSINPQLMALRGGADVVVGTPGRLLDLMAQRGLVPGQVRTLVLDEADRLLARGFAEELEELLKVVAGRRQTLLFSATFPKAVHGLAERILRDPVRVVAEPEDGAAAVAGGVIDERAIEVDRAERTPLLRHLLAEREWARVLVFTATKYTSDHVVEKLRRAGIEAAAWHGELSQGARTTTLADFKAGRVRVLVATDLAARGLDIVELPAVVNYDLPRSPEDYTHRIGRTGRAGQKGEAVTFVSAENWEHFRLIERKVGREIPREQVDGFMPMNLTPPEVVKLAGGGGIKGKRPSKKDKLRAAAARGDTSRGADG